jgi:carbamoyltransferase
VEHHLAHPAAAFYTSPFEHAAVVVCDRHDPHLSVWRGSGSDLLRVDWPAGITDLATVYSQGSTAFGFGHGEEHQLEALARLDPLATGAPFAELILYADGALHVASGWVRVLEEQLAAAGGSITRRAGLASAFQKALGEALLRFAGDVRAHVGAPHLCLGGGLFYNTYFNTLIRCAAGFDDVFVPPNPGNPGAAAGAALAVDRPAAARPRAAVSPFLGPEYDLEEIKRTLDNCKLSYECMSEGEMLASTVDALRNGRLVGWFHGRMEWGHRALGNRSILASPLSPYVLDNLNVYLKHRERHRTYGLSVLEREAPRYFSGPPASRFMEYDFEVRDRVRLQHVLPEGVRTLRVQTVPDSPDFRRFSLLLDAFGRATGVPVLVNTSFNGFSEPIVCSPRDAVRLFYGSGLDLLVLDRFVVRK